MTREIIHTADAPEAIGPYSQAVKVGDIGYLSGQIPLVPETMTVLWQPSLKPLVATCRMWSNSISF